MAGLLVTVWLTVFVCMIRAVLIRDILWPQRQEDRDEGGWTAGREKQRIPPRDEENHLPFTPIRAFHQTHGTALSPSR